MIANLSLPVTLETSAPITLRRATEPDLPVLMALLSDDPISASRGDRADMADAAAYGRALSELIADPSNEIIVAVDEHGSVVATMQLTRIPGMARRGTTRFLVEAVRVDSAHRSNGVGGAMMRWVTDTAAPMIGAGLVQLTSDNARKDAHRFYERLGFVGSHRGFKYRVG